MILLLLYEMSFLSLVYLAWNRHTYFFAEQFEHFAQLEKSIVFLTFILILILYSGFFFLIPKVLQFSFRELCFLLVPLVLILAVTPPILSMDAGSYMIYAKSWFSYGQNPYVVSLSSFTANPWVSEFSNHWWSEFTSPYGPLFTLLLGPIVFFSKSLLMSVLVYKVLLVGIYVGCVGLCQRIVRLHQLPESITTLFALNPALLIHGVLEGHNDVLILFSILLAVYWFSNQWVKSVTALSLGIAIKVIPIVLLPAYIAQNKKIFWKRILPSLGIVVGVFLVAFLPFHFPFQAFSNNLSLRSEAECFYGCSPIIRLFVLVYPDVQSWFLSLISIVLFILIWYFTAWKSLKVLEYLFWILFVLFFIFSPTFAPWYSVSLISIGILLSSQIHYRLLTITVLFYSFIHYFGV